MSQASNTPRSSSVPALRQRPPRAHGISVNPGPSCLRIVHPHHGGHAAHDPRLRDRLAQAVELRHQALQHTAGLNREVFDSLVLLAAGDLSPDAISLGYDHVQGLVTEMDLARRSRLVRLGWSDAEAATLSALHTRNFM